MDLLRLKAPGKGFTRLALAPNGKARADDLVRLEDMDYPLEVVAADSISATVQTMLINELGDDLGTVSYIYRQVWEA